MKRPRWLGPSRNTGSPGGDGNGGPTADDWGRSASDGLWAERLQLLLFTGGMAALLVLVAVAQFRGFRSPVAMELAQLAGNLAGGHGYVTDCVRPLEAHAGRVDPAVRAPDLRQPPLYPLLAAGVLRMVQPARVMDRQSGLFRPETHGLVPLGILLTLGVGVVLGALTRRLYGPAAGLLAVAVFFLADGVVFSAISGTAAPLAALLTMIAIFSGVVASDRIREGRAWYRWVPPLVGAGGCLGAAALTEYLLLPLLLPGLLTFLVVRINRFRLLAPVVVLGVVIVVVAPWAYRNLALCGNPLGTALVAMSGDAAGGMDRARAAGAGQVWRTVAAGLGVGNMLTGARAALGALGCGLVLSGFAISFFSRPDDDDAQALRWVVLLPVLGALWLAGALPAAAAVVLQACLPLCVAVGAGFVIELLNRTVGLEEGTRRVALVVFVVVGALPLVARVADGRPERAYPPYSPTLAAFVGGLMEEGETLVTDIPWATAWYGGQRSLLLPRRFEQLQELRAAGWKLNGLYLTTATGNRPYLSELVEGPESDWLPFLNRRVPADFPLTNGVALPPGTRDQIFLSDRVRWQSAPPEAL